MIAYRPTDTEPFMNERQQEYFRQKLLAWKEDILKELKETLQLLRDGNQNHPDSTDRASSETDRAIELRARDRQRKLIAKIDAALTRVEGAARANVSRMRRFTEQPPLWRHVSFCWKLNAPSGEHPEGRLGKPQFDCFADPAAAQA
jgi:RNA polymerase-binding protein DksA